MIGHDSGGSTAVQCAELRSGFYADRLAQEEQATVLYASESGSRA